MVIDILLSSRNRKSILARDMTDHSFRYHPKNVLLSLVLAGLIMLFMALSFAYVYTRIQSDIPAIRLPALFFVNIFILAASSWTVIRAEQAYETDLILKYLKLLSATLFFSVLFVLFQFLAWMQLFNNHIYWNSNLSSSYTYALSFLHAIHVIVGLPFMAWFVIHTNGKLKDPVSTLLYFADENESRRLKLLSKYWHFLDLLWIFIVLFLGVNMIF